MTDQREDLTNLVHALLDRIESYKGIDGAVALEDLQEGLYEIESDELRNVLTKAARMKINRLLGYRM